MSSYTVSFLSSVTPYAEAIVSPLVHTVIPLAVGAKVGNIFGALRGKFVYAMNRGDRDYESTVIANYTRNDQVHMTVAIAAIALGEIGSFCLSTEAGLYFSGGVVVGGLVGRVFWPFCI